MIKSILDIREDKGEKNMWFYLFVIIDQAIKFFVESKNLNIPIIKDIFNIIYTQNTGGIYGILQGKNYLFIILSIEILAVLFFFAYKEKGKNGKKYAIWQFVIAGGVSNVIDRIFRGYVVDFIQLKLFGIFNLADSMIVLGVIAIIIMDLKELKNESNNNNSVL